MDQSSLDLEQLRANTYVPLLGVGGGGGLAGLLLQGLPGLSKSASEGPWAAGMQKE